MPVVFVYLCDKFIKTGDIIVSRRYHYFAVLQRDVHGRILVHSSFRRIRFWKPYRKAVAPFLNSTSHLIITPCVSTMILHRPRVFRNADDESSKNGYSVNSTEAIFFFPSLSGMLPPFGLISFSRSSFRLVSQAFLTGFQSLIAPVTGLSDGLKIRTT